jgi:hypothetical protein
MLSIYITKIYTNRAVVIVDVARCTIFSSLLSVMAKPILEDSLLCVLIFDAGPFEKKTHTPL